MSASMDPTVCRKAHADDADRPEGRLDLLLQHGSQIERFAPLQSLRREDEVVRLVVETLRPPLQQGLPQTRMHRQKLCRCFRFCALQVPTPTPVVGMLHAEIHVVEVAVQPT